MSTEVEGQIKDQKKDVNKNSKSYINKMKGQDMCLIDLSESHNHAQQINELLTDVAKDINGFASHNYGTEINKYDGKKCLQDQYEDKIPFKVNGLKCSVVPENDLYTTMIITYNEEEIIDVTVGFDFFSISDLTLDRKDNRIITSERYTGMKDISWEMSEYIKLKTIIMMTIMEIFARVQNK